ncbi:hypothetical protein EJV46_10870 [Roseococcus sp. SYP-B2431]|uniref:hypothetical protein n=1 Tax=Roseococcus sp. SYP-B2431 TaxID=2496640 RepID=UPI00103A02EA|nr:hypothetical protein [Roseococcus sp. SYP-B2431]TCH99038.1 hypothetical protein EJV46_10870 [Roseococcus sp. SYP-B2431]
MEPTPEPETIDSNFRNGSLTAVGIILGFSLNFLSHWASNPLDWSTIDLLPLTPLAVGIGFQVEALAELLRRDSLLATRYERAMRVFLVGVLLVASGIALALLNDILGVSRQKMFG